MKVIKDPRKMLAYSTRMKQRGQKIGLVPTMGYLHAGHLSLVKAAKKISDKVVVSIFVNPAQFGPKEDLARYPKNLACDKKLLRELKVDVVFTPSTSQMYPEGSATWVEVAGLSSKMCGRSRPGHFRGVTTIVAKLFNITAPDVAFFGEKDFQQQVIIRQMVKGLNSPVKIVSLPIVREPDGLAMSSRNKYLTAKQRKQAPILYLALQLAKDEISLGEKNPRRIAQGIRSLLRAAPDLRLDYCVIVDPQTLESVKKIRGRVVVALAAYLGRARLIDNIVVGAK